MARGKYEVTNVHEIGQWGGDCLPQQLPSGGLKRRRPRSIEASKGRSVDVHGILFVVLAIVFVVWPAAQWIFGL